MRTDQDKHLPISASLANNIEYAGISLAHAYVAMSR